MIKVNLASRKRMNVNTGTNTGIGIGSVGNPLKNLDFEQVKYYGLPILRKIILPIFIAFLANQMLEDYQNKELKKVTDQIDAVEKEKKELQVQIDKKKAFEEQKKIFESDAADLKKKIEAIESLMAERGATSKMMVSLSSSIPTDVWLTSFETKNGNKIVMRGESTGYNAISDFIKNLDESDYFSHVSLKNTEQSIEGNQVQNARFELEADHK